MSIKPSQPMPPPAPPANDQPRKRALILIVGTAIVVSMAYLSGLRTSTGRLREKNQELTRLKTQVDVARSDVTRRDATIRHLEARRQLHLSLIALDERNFGIAQGHLNAAAILLGNAGGGEAFTNLTRQIRATNLVAAADFAEQRQQILEFARRLDAAIPPESLPGHDMGGPAIPGAPSATP